MKIFLTTLAVAMMLTGAALAQTDATSPDDGATSPPLPVEVTSVTINPLGAPANFPWTVHDEELDVHTGPDTGYPSIGKLKKGDKVAGEYNIVTDTDEEWLKIPFNSGTGWISRTGVFRPHPTNVENVAKHGNIPYGEEIVNRWWALPSDYEADDLVDIPAEFTPAGRPRDADAPRRERSDDSDRKYQMRREARDHLLLMFTAAKADGVMLYASSPYRSWPTQKRIYDGNVRRRPNQRSSAPPGHSEHQLGSTTDISGTSGRGFIGRDWPEHDWLEKHGAEYGFRQTYRPDNLDETGYIEEPWHWRYLGVDKTMK